MKALVYDGIQKVQCREVSDPTLKMGQCPATRYVEPILEMKFFGVSFCSFLSFMHLLFY